MLLLLVALAGPQEPAPVPAPSDVPATATTGTGTSVPTPPEAAVPAGTTAAPESAGAPEATPAPPARSLGVGERKRELEQLRKRLADLKARFAATQKRKADQEAALHAAVLNLEIQTAERRVVEIRYVETERETVRAAAERDAAAAEVGGLRRDLSFRAAALYRMGRLGYLRALVAAESGTSLLRGLQVMTHLARRDAQMLGRYETALANFGKRETELSARRDELSALAAESRKREAQLSAARAEKAALLTRTTRDAEGEKRAVASLEEKSQRLAALLDLLETRGRSLPAGAASVRKFRGVLDWPAKGEVAVPFGRIANPKFPKTFLRSSGWTIAAATGAEIHAVFAGDVVYAQWLKGYGNLVVLDHGDNVFTLYGRLATGTAQRGERIGVGDRVGVLGDAPEDEVPGLYFEIRDQRASVDPRDWLK